MYTYFTRQSLAVGEEKGPCFVAPFSPPLVFLINPILQDQVLTFTQKKGKKIGAHFIDLTEGFVH